MRLNSFTQKLAAFGALLCMLCFSFQAQAQERPILSLVGSFATGVFDESAAEIVAYDSISQRMFVVNANDNRIDVIDVSDPTTPVALDPIANNLGNPNSVAFGYFTGTGGGYLAVAYAADSSQAPGTVGIFTTLGTQVSALPVGALPDMVAISPNGKFIVTANEGEPNDDYTVDPEGSVSIIDLDGNLIFNTVRTADFTAYNDSLEVLTSRGVRIFGPNATVAQDLEPEFITFSGDGNTAFVACQENNALAVVDLASATVTDIIALGFKDHSKPGMGFDASNRDGKINIQPWPVYGMYQPDAITSYMVDGAMYIVTANEGDARDYDGFSEEARIGDDDIVLDPVAFPNAAELKEDENLGRLKITTTLGDTDGDGDYDKLYAYGARSFSIWNAAGELVWDSGEDFERITAKFIPEDFNSTNDETAFDNRSDDKGPEPEAVEIVPFGGKMYALIALERVGGIMVYDVSVPTAPKFIQYINNRDFSADPESAEALDLGPEDITFIPAAGSPLGVPMVAVANEVSGTTSLYEFNLGTQVCEDSVVIPTEEELAIGLFPIGTYNTGSFDEGASEIIAFDPGTNRLYSTNADANSVDIINLENPFNPTLIRSINFDSFGGGVNSVAVGNTPNVGTIFVVAVENDSAQLGGRHIYYDQFGNYLNDAVVGALPDMVTFSPNGRYLIGANEGEPNDDYTHDPEGSVSYFTFEGAGGVFRTVDFAELNDAELDPSIRIFGPNATVAQDLEPEFVAVSPDSKYAYVSCQENNAIVVVDLAAAEIVDIFGFGFKDHSLACQGFDASNRDDSINIQSWPIYGMYQPDAMEAYTVNGETYLVTANEGDARDYDGFSEEARIGDDEIVLDSVAFPNAEMLKMDENLGRLKITTTLGDTDGDGDYDELYAYGARSFSIWTTSGDLVWDSGEDFEQITAKLIPEYFNSTNDESAFDNRSDDKGPEPEAITIGKINDSYYAFIGLERVGGIMVYDITDPTAPEFVQYVNNRDFSADPETAEAGDLGPEGMVFIPAATSPNDRDLLVVSNEVSGTITVYQITDDVVSNEELLAVNGGLSVAPNPFSDFTQIEFRPAVSGNATISLYNLNGQFIETLFDAYADQSQVQEVRLNASNLNAGIYILRMESANDDVQFQKLVVTK